jgi:hypothetical protein
VKTTFFRIIIIGSNYDAEKSGFHAESRVRALFFPRDTLRIPFLIAAAHGLEPPVADHACMLLLMLRA